MYLVHVNYIQPIEEVEKFLVAHRSFLDKYYASGNLIVSGPRNPRIGGILLCNATSRNEVWSIIKEDPFYLNNIAEYEVIEFNPVKFAKDFEAFIRQ